MFDALILAAGLGLAIWGVVCAARRIVGTLWADEEIPYVSQDWLEALREQRQEEPRDDR